jgi:signal transduction histidine kinase
MRLLEHPEAEHLTRPSHPIAVVLPPGPGERTTLAETALDSLSDRVVAVNRRGIIIAVNAVWTESAERWGVPPQASGPGADYFDVCRRLPGGASQDADAAFLGIRAVCGGAASAFETAYQCDACCECWCVTRVTPLRHPDGGVVIAHTDVTQPQVAELARLTGHELRARLVAAQEAERSYIARELHDDIAQRVALLASGIETMLLDNPGAGKRIHQGLVGARRHLRDISTAIHALSHHLHPGKLKLLGLVPTLKSLCRDVSDDGVVAVSLETDGVPDNVAHDTAMCVFRVAQEALHNVVKHSGARVIHVLLSATDSHLTLRVTDDGTGFDPLAVQSPGIGLLTMRERVELLGGTLRIEPVLPHGTTIEATIPLLRASNGAS